MPSLLYEVISKPFGSESVGHGYLPMLFIMRQYTIYIKQLQASYFRAIYRAKVFNCDSMPILDKMSLVYYILQMNSFCIRFKQFGIAKALKKNNLASELLVDQGMLVNYFFSTLDKHFSSW